MTKYIGLTIGPIYKTMMKAKKTRELWGASYLFSYLMKNIIKKVNGNKDEFDVSFVVPNVSAIQEFMNPSDLQKSGVGLFHDRFICKVNKSFLAELSDIIESILSETADKMANVDDIGIKKSAFEDYLKNYLRVYFCEIDSDKNINEINEDINKHLDALELMTKFIIKEDVDCLGEFLNRVNRSFLNEDAFHKTRRPFPSIPEIAAREFDFKVIKPKPAKNNPFDTDEPDIYDQLESVHGKTAIKTYHKYIAIVQADGDDLGITITGLTQNKAFESFSEALFKFADKANKIIKENGGTTIYAGGDDLLFFSPVMYNKVSVFEVCHLLSDCFRGKMAEALGRNDNLPTMSFGISISYYKYPMYEALEAAQTQLFDKAKKFRGKNAVSFRYLKHSGASFDGTVSRNSEIYPHFRRLITADLTSEILTSVIHDIRQYSALLLEIGADLTRLRYFFENKYNEDIHKGYTGFFESVTAFIHEVCCTCKYSEKEKIHLIHSVLKLKKNLMGEEDK